MLSAKSHNDEEFGARVRARFIFSDRTYDGLDGGVSLGLDLVARRKGAAHGRQKRNFPSPDNTSIASIDSHRYFA